MRTLYPHPFSRAYWRAGSEDSKKLRLLVFSALMIAMARAMAMIPSIPVGHTKFNVSFLARAVCAMVVGPQLSLVYGFAEDILGFIIKPTGEFFIGYTISTMAGMLVYALCFYRSKITVRRILLANVLVNVFVNALLGSVWTTMLRGGAYWAWFGPSLGKNLVTVLPKSLMMYLLYSALLPILCQMHLVPWKQEKRLLPW